MNSLKPVKLDNDEIARRKARLERFSKPAPYANTTNEPKYLFNIKL